MVEKVGCFAPVKWLAGKIVSKMTDNVVHYSTWVKLWNVSWIASDEWLVRGLQNETPTWIQREGGVVENTMSEHWDLGMKKTAPESNSRLIC